MKPPVEIPSTLSPHRVFVVQFWAETDVRQGRCTGRVEYVVSGQAMRFASLEELLAFIAQVLARPRPATEETTKQQVRRRVSYSP